MKLIKHVNQLLMQYVLFFGHRLIQTHNAFEIWARIFSLEAFERSKPGSPDPKERQRDHTCNSDTLVARKFRFISNRRNKSYLFYT